MRSLALGLRWPRRGAAGLTAGWLACAGALAGPVEVRVADMQGRALAGAVVFLESREARAAVRPLAGAEVSQVARQFAPLVSVVTVGTPVTFPNRDTVRHHVYSFSPVKKFEIKLYVGVPGAPVVFDQPGIAVLGCNIHDNMVSWVVVVETPWFGHTGNDGRLALPQVPAGSYRLRAWHPSLPPGAPAHDQALVVGSALTQASVPLGGTAP